MALSIHDALSKLGNLKSQVARAERYAMAGLSHYEDEKPDYSFRDECLTREQILKDILSLKAQIQVTNAVTRTEYKGKKYALAELILINADMRSELAFKNKLLESSLNETSWHSKRTRDDIKKVFAEGYSKPKLREEIALLEKEKEEIESVLNVANTKTILVEI